MCDLRTLLLLTQGNKDRLFQYDRPLSEVEIDGVITDIDQKCLFTPINRNDHLSLIGQWKIGRACATRTFCPQWELECAIFIGQQGTPVPGGALAVGEQLYGNGCAEYPVARVGVQDIAVQSQNTTLVYQRQAFSERE